MGDIERRYRRKEPPQPKETYVQVVTRTLREKGRVPLWDGDKRRVFGEWLGEPLVHTIDTVLKDRTWAASVPFLSTGNNPEAATDALAAYVAVGLWYIYDDIDDQRMVRYGNQTAFGKLATDAYAASHSWEDAYQKAGEISMDSWNAAINLGEVGKRVLGNDPSRIAAWNQTFVEIEIAQHKRFNADEAITLEEYAQNSIERTKFIGDWWKRAAVVSGDIALAEMIDKGYPLCALAGQVRNDIANVYDFENKRGGVQYSDFTNGKRTAITIATLDSALPQDRQWIMDTVFNKRADLSDAEQVELRRIIEASGALDATIHWATTLVTTLEDLVQTAHIPDDVKTIWMGWIDNQFKVDMTGNAQQADDEQASKRFIEAANRLSN